MKWLLLTVVFALFLASTVFAAPIALVSNSMGVFNATNAKMTPLNVINNNTGFFLMAANATDADNQTNGSATFHFCRTNSFYTAGWNFSALSCVDPSWADIPALLNESARGFFNVTINDSFLPATRYWVWFAVDNVNTSSATTVNASVEINHPPTGIITAPVLNVTTARRGDFINCSYGIGTATSDPDNDTVFPRWRWYFDGVLIANRTSDSLNITKAILDNHAVIGQNVTCEMTDWRDTHSYFVGGNPPFSPAFNSSNSAQILDDLSNLVITIVSPVNATYTDWCASENCKLYFNFSTTGTGLSLCDINLTQGGVEIYHTTSSGCVAFTRPIISNGEYEVFVYAVNGSGVTGGNDTVIFTVNIPSPSSVFSQPSGSYNVTTIPINVTANPCTETLVLEINGTNSTVFSNASSCSPIIAYYTTISRTSGNYTIKAFASDHLGSGDTLRTSVTTANFEVAIPVVIPPASPIIGKVTGGTAVLLNIVPLIFALGFLAGGVYLMLKKVNIITIGIYVILGIVAVGVIAGYVAGFV